MPGNKNTIYCVNMAWKECIRTVYKLQMTAVWRTMIANACDRHGM